MKVLIIGGAGFIGLAIAQELKKQGIQAQVADSFERIQKVKTELVNFTTSQLNYPDIFGIETILQGFDGLILLSCTTIPSSSMESVVYDAQTNIIPSLEIFTVASRLGVKRIIFSSSGGTVYGVPRKLPVSEECPTRPISAYGVSKLTVENYLSLFDSFVGISLRTGNPFGAFQLKGTAIGVIANFLTKIRNDEPLEIWGDGTIVRDFLSIDDVAKAFVLALTKENIFSGSYNIGSGVGLSINEIISIVFEVTGREVPIIYKNSRNFDVPAIVLDSSKFSSVTGWKANTSRLKENIAKMWEVLK